MVEEHNCCFGPVRDLELPVDGGETEFDCVDADPDPLGDLRVRHSSSRHPKRLDLAGREIAKRTTI
jgi:hypothetical protein